MRLLLAAVVLLSSITRADDLNELKSCVTCAGDLDADGVPDLWIASRDGEHGVVWAVSGCDGSLLHVLQPAPGFDEVVAELAVIGDIDGDRVLDLAVASRPSAVLARCHYANAYVFSGRSSSFLFEFEDSWGVAAAGDVDGDGVPDILLGIPGGASVRSGRDGSLVCRVVTPVRETSFRGSSIPHSVKSVRGIGDVDEDCVPDFVVGAPGWTDGLVREGSLFLVSTRRREVIAELRGDAWHAAVGWEMSNAGDLDGDGFGDWLVGANEDPVASSYGWAEVRSGRDGRVVRKLVHSPKHGVDVASAGDVNGDGMDDHVIVIPGLHVARILSGRDGSLVRKIDLAKLRERSSDPTVLRTR